MSGPFPSSVTTVPAAPVSHLPDGRLDVLDILRGLAIAGMILVHWHQRIGAEATGWQDAIAWAVWVLVEQKSWGIFAFLFGVGFAVLLRQEHGAAQVGVGRGIRGGELPGEHFGRRGGARAIEARPSCGRTRAGSPPPRPWSAPVEPGWITACMPMGTHISGQKPNWRSPRNPRGATPVIVNSRTVEPDRPSHDVRVHPESAGASNRSSAPPAHWPPGAHRSAGRIGPPRAACRAR